MSLALVSLCLVVGESTSTRMTGFGINIEVWRRCGPAENQGIGLIDGVFVDSHARPVWQNFARQTGSYYRLAKREKNACL